MVQMGSSVSHSRLDARRYKWLPALDAARYMVLAILATFTLMGDHPARFLDLGLCALAAAWMLWMFTLHPAWRTRTLVMTPFFIVVVAIMTALVISDPLFGFLAPIGYSYAFEVLPWPGRLAGIASVAMVVAISQTSGVPRTTTAGMTVYVAVLAANVLCVCGLAWFMWANNKAHEERKDALREMNEANNRLKESLAENAGLHEQLLTQAREAGVLDERQRMAREIHDTLAQGLIGIITQLQAAEQASENQEEWRRHFVAATGLARESLSEARRSVDALRPEPLQTERLSEALAHVAERWSVLHGVAVRVTTTGTARPVQPQVEFALLRMMQESLANVARHAQATQIELTLSYMDHEVGLYVRDDGKGFEPARLVVGDGGDAGIGPADLGSSGGGFGLVAMRQRIDGVAGTLHVQSEPGTGTTISACVPVAAAEARA